MTHQKLSAEARADLRKTFDDLVASLDAAPAGPEGLAADEALDSALLLHADHVIDRCEGCGCVVLEGEQAFSYQDGPTTCLACSPTWSDLKSEQEEMIAAGTFEDSFDDGPEMAKKVRSDVLAHIDAGDGDNKATWEH